MKEVRTICELALEESAPPLRDGAEALAIARQATARRNRLRFAGSGVVAVAVAGVLGVPAVAGWQAAPADNSPPGVEATAARPAPSATTTAPPATPAKPPSAHAAPAHGYKLADVLKAAVPPGYRITHVNGPKDDKKVYSRTLRLKPNEQMLSAFAQVDIVAGRGGGQLMAVILYNGRKAPTGDLCSPDIPGNAGHVALSCEVVTVDGVRIKVTREQAEYGEVIGATRYLDGGMLMVSSWQGLPRYEQDRNLPPDVVVTKRRDREHRPPLAEPPLTVQQVAELAADPAMLP